MTYLQGFRARSWIEFSLLKKCVSLIVRPGNASIPPPPQILFVPLHQRHLHILTREYLLAIGPRPRQFSSENT